MLDSQLPQLIIYKGNRPNLDPGSVIYYRNLLENWQKRLSEFRQRSPSEAAVDEIKNVQMIIIDHQKQIGKQTRKIKNLLPGSYNTPAEDQKQVLRKLKFEFSFLISEYSAAWRGMKIIVKREKTRIKPLG